jgi:transposase
MEVLQSDRSLADIARAYDVHPVTVSNWKRHFEEHGAEVFGGKEEIKTYEKRLADLERIVGKKEVEIALLKNILGER